MNSRLTLGFAGILLVGGLAAGYWGVSLSGRPQVVAEAAPEVPTAAPLELSGADEVRRQVGKRIDEEQRSSVVVLARPLKPWVPIVAEDLAVERLRIAPPESFAGVEELLGRMVSRELPAGSVLSSASFVIGGPLARMIRADERAMAIAVDEVIGGGGHLAPGDYVDALLYLRDSERNAERTAQVVVPALRVLSVGSALGPTNTGEPALPQGEDEDEAEEKAKRRPRKEAARTAVLAVPAPLLTRFMLAAEVGSLRLAVRSADERRLANYYAGAAPLANVEELERQLFKFERLAVRPAHQARGSLAARQQPAGIQVYRGTDVSRQTP